MMSALFFTHMFNRKLQRFFYRMLFVLLFGTLALFLFTLFGVGEMRWEIYSKIYFVLMLAYTWYIFFLLFRDDYRKVKYPKYANEKITVLVPCYNEDHSLFRLAIESVIQAKGNKEIVVIDDGSTNDIHLELNRLQRIYPEVKVHRFERNRGKRHALHHAMTQLVDDSDFVVTIDSDTILDEDALIKVVEPLKMRHIGAATGDVRLRNEKQNWLTRMIGTYYWIGLNVYKKAQSSLGNVVCCSGCLAAYRTDLLKEIIDEFVNQEFFGESCTHSEDRHLTNLILKMGYSVVYTPESISHTETPATIKGFLKQQQRWKRGFIRESIYTLSYAWKTRKLLFFQILLWDLSAPFFTFGLWLALLVTIFLNPLFFLTSILPSWIIFMFIRFIFVVLHAKEKIRGLFFYMLFYEIFLYPMNIYALFTVKNKSWITR
jgi:hyaluronan synthase